MSFFSRKTRRDTTFNTARPRCRLQVEALEDRSVPSAGALDPTFGTGGLVVTDLGSTSDRAFDMVIQSDGKIITAGDTISKVGSFTSQNFALVRYHVNGTLDTSFGINGRAVTDFKGTSDAAQTMAQQIDGKIIVAGSTNTSKGFQQNSAFALARYWPDGSLDTSFGTKGKVITELGSATDNINDMAIQSDGKIVVAGTTHSFSGGGDFALARYNTNGSLDTTFGNGGFVVTDFSGRGDAAESIAIQANGKIVVVGTTFLSDRDVLSMARYNANGTLDASFGSQGKVTTVIGIYNGGRDVVIQADGRIVAAGIYGTPGSVPDSSTANIALSRYLDNGALDPAFGVSGVVTLPVTGGYGAMYKDPSVAVQADGKIIAAGLSWSNSNLDFLMARVNTDGSLDATFGVGGVVSTDFGTSSEDVPNVMRIQADGKIVAAGQHYNTGTSGYDIALARYLPSAPHIGSFTANPSPATVGNPVTLTAANVQALNPGSTITQVAFYADRNGDGKLDPTTDTLLGYGIETSTGTWTLSFTFSTAGTYKLFAQAMDNFGVFSDPMALDLQVL